MKERLLYIDALRGFAIFLVVLGHILIFNGYEKSIITTTIYSFHMPLFMFISGYVARYSYKKIEDIKSFYNTVLRKFITILLPYIVFCVFVRPLFFCSPMNYLAVFKDNGIQSFFLSEYWFLPCLFILQICFILYMLINDKIERYRFYLKIFTITILSVSLFVFYQQLELQVLKQCMMYIFFYFGGVLMMEYSNIFVKICKNHYIIFLLFITFAVLCGIYNVEVGKGILAKICRFICGLSSIPIFFSIFSELSDKYRIYNVLKNIGVNTLGIYLIHYIFVKDWEINNLSIFPMLVVSILGSLLVIGCCLIIIYFIKKNKVLSLLLLGKR